MKARVERTDGTQQRRVIWPAMDPRPRHLLAETTSGFLVNCNLLDQGWAKSKVGLGINCPVANTGDFSVRGNSAPIESMIVRQLDLAAPRGCRWAALKQFQQFD